MLLYRADECHKSKRWDRSFKVLILLLFIAANLSTAAQKRDSIHHNSIRVLAKAFGDSIIIRWAPEKPAIWQLCNQAGYHIIRIDYSNPAHPVTTDFSSTVLRPMALNEINAKLNTKDKYVAIAAQCLYGNDFTITTPTSISDKISQGNSVMNFRYMFAMQSADYSAQAANALALRWVDKGVKSGGKYQYKISSVAADAYNVVDTGTVYIINVVSTKGSSPQGLRAFGFDHRIELHWDRRQLPGYDAYFIERSDDGGKTYHILNKTPFSAPYQAPPRKSPKMDSMLVNVESVFRDHQVFLDSVPKNYKNYYYRVSGLNAFAETSDYSEAVKAHGVDLTPPIAPHLDSVWNTIGTEMEITWTQHQTSADLRGYLIGRSNLPKGPFNLITKEFIGKEKTSFVDPAAIPHSPNYYVIEAVDSAGNTANSLPRVAYLIDSIPPAAPTGVAGIIDSSGAVHLHWKKNSEPDLMGYKVYYSYNPNYQFSQLTQREISQTEFTDSIPMNTLNREIYYRVVAVDRNNNHSAYSEPAKLTKPIVVPPSMPVPGKVSADKSGAHIQWIESRSEGAAGYEIYRQENGKDWKPIARLNQDWQVNSLSYTDSTIQPNIDYYYAAETIDSTGIHSKRSFAVHVRYSNSHTLVAPGPPVATWDAKHKEVKLSWAYSGEGNYFFILYKAQPGNPLAPWHSFDKGTLSCLDNRVREGNYQYALKVVSDDHSHSSEVSKPAQIEIPH